MVELNTLYEVKDIKNTQDFSALKSDATSVGNDAFSRVMNSISKTMNQNADQKTTSSTFSNDRNFYEFTSEKAGNNFDSRPTQEVSHSDFFNTKVEDRFSPQNRQQEFVKTDYNTKESSAYVSQNTHSVDKNQYDSTKQDFKSSDVTKKESEKTSSEKSKPQSDNNSVERTSEKQHEETQKAKEVGPEQAENAKTQQSAVNDALQQAQLKDKIELSSVYGLNLTIKTAESVKNVKSQEDSKKQAISEKTSKQDAGLLAPVASKVAPSSKETVVKPVTAKEQSVQQQNKVEANAGKESSVNLLNDSQKPSVAESEKSTIEKGDTILKSSKSGELLVQMPVGESKNPEKTSHSVSKDALLGEKLDNKAVISKIEVQKNSQQHGENSKQEQNFSSPDSKVSNALFSQSFQSASTSTDKVLNFDKVLNSKTSAGVVPESVINQVGKNISKEMGPDKSSISMILRPENLGRVDVNIATVNGVLTAQIITENSQVKDALNKEIENLKQNLQDKGLNVSNIVVQVQEPAQTNNSNNNSQKEFDQSQSKFENFNQNNSQHADSKFGQGSSKQSGYESAEKSDISTPEESAKKEASQIKQNDGRVDYTI